MIVDGAIEDFANGQTFLHYQKIYVGLNKKIKIYFSSKIGVHPTVVMSALF